MGGADNAGDQPRHDHDWAMGETEWVGAPPDRRVRGRRGTISAFLVGALAGLVALGVVWATTVILTDTDGGTSSAATTAGTSTATTGTEPSPETDAPTSPSPTDRCREAAAELAAPLRVAVPALDQWQVHVGAMNKLVLGAITPEQAAEFWEQSKVGATRNLARFDSASRRVPAARVCLSSPGALAQASAELRSCTRYVVQERRALAAARIAIRTWKRHVRDMAMLEMGHLSPADATEMWLANWRRGVRELAAFRSADRAVKRSQSC
jgi:hypothetical protein